MAVKIYRDQVERFYDLEALEYSQTDIASLCVVSTSQFKIWRRENPHPEDYPERPAGALGLPAVRPKRVNTKPGPPTWLQAGHTPQRAKRPEPRGPAPVQATTEAPAAPLPRESLPVSSGGNARFAKAPASDLPGKGKPRSPAFALAEKYPPGTPAEKARAGALRPVTKGQLDNAVEKALKQQRAELLKEIKAASFDPVVTWQTEVNHEAFDPVRALVQLAHVPGCPEHTILGVLRELVRLRKERAKVAWDQVKLDDIPVEHRPRLAGQLVEWLEVAELPLEVQDHDAVREVYELTGVALPKPADADAFMARWESVLEDMRTDAEMRVETLRASGKLVMDGPPKKAAEFRVRPSTGSAPT